MVPLETPELTTSLSTRREERGEEERGHRRKGNDSLSTGVPLPKNGTKPHNTWCGNVHATSVCVCVCVCVGLGVYFETRLAAFEPWSSRSTHACIDQPGKSR